MMTALHLHLKVAGTCLFLLVLMNLLLPRRFRWADELGAVSLLTRQVFFVHHLFIAFTIAMMASLSPFFSGILLEPSPLARLVLLGLCLFWSLRLLVQLFVYDSRLWRGSSRRTAAHVAFTGLWVYLASVYGSALWKIS